MTGPARLRRRPRASCVGSRHGRVGQLSRWSRSKGSQAMEPGSVAAVYDHVHASRPRSGRGRAHPGGSSAELRDTGVLEWPLEPPEKDRRRQGGRPSRRRGFARCDRGPARLLWLQLRRRAEPARSAQDRCHHRGERLGHRLSANRFPRRNPKAFRVCEKLSCSMRGAGRPVGCAVYVRRYCPGLHRTQPRGAGAGCWDRLPLHGERNAPLPPALRHSCEAILATDHDVLGMRWFACAAPASRRLAVPADSGCVYSQALDPFLVGGTACGPLPSLGTRFRSIVGGARPAPCGANGH